MANSAKSHDVRVEHYAPTAPLESILCTEELHRRPSRPPNYEKENGALVTLVNGLADSPSTVTSETMAEREKAEADIREVARGLEAKVRRLVDANVVGIVMWNLNGTITGANEAFLRMVQYDRNDLVSGRVRWEDLTPAEWRGQAEQAVADLKATGIFQPFEKEYFRKDGSRVPVLLGGALFDGCGNEGVAFVLDLSEQKRAERALRRSQAFLAEGQRLGQIGSFSWSVATDEITWSAELYRIYELEIGAPVTLELIRSRVHPEDVSLIEKMKMVDQEREGGDDFEWQYRLLMPDHSIKYMHAVAHATRGEEGQLEYIASVQDVTARRLAEEARDKARSELAYAARVMTLGTLTASIAHELTQPLSGIVTNASTCLRMLAADPPNIEGARETARRTIRDGNRASEVITRLRALFSKKDTATECVNLNEVAREAIALSLADLQKNGVILHPELADNLPLVTGDRIQLQQVILNLVLNASDAMSGVDDRPRQLVIKTESEDDRARLTVQDVGVGIEPYGVEKLFEPFYTTKSGGMGIGLSVSRSIIESHHGRLWASLNDGPGAAFSFSIPRAPRDKMNPSADSLRPTPMCN
jgi:PAS domain S-box-containing protein